MYIKSNRVNVSKTRVKNMKKSKQKNVLCIGFVRCFVNILCIFTEILLYCVQNQIHSKNILSIKCWQRKYKKQRNFGYVDIFGNF